MSGQAFTAYNVAASLMPNPLESLSIEQDASRAWTLPAQLYTDAAVYAAEKDNVFSRSWQVVGHHRQVENQGDYFTTVLTRGTLLISAGNGVGLQTLSA